MLLKNDCEVVTANGVDEGLRAIADAPPDLILLDLVMPGRSGFDLLTAVAAGDSPPPVVVLTGHQDRRDRGGGDEARRRGLRHQALRGRRAADQDPPAPRAPRPRGRGRAPAREGREAGAPGRAPRRAASACRRSSTPFGRSRGSRATVLIRGESGTGKELVARAIHDARRPPRRALRRGQLRGDSRDTLIESELFGHERGAFTDARERRIGMFEAADGGTLFLDEIGELAPGVQAKLLRVLQERRIERVGGSAADRRRRARDRRDEPRPRAATSPSGRFRADLFYRINVVPIELPPLRERREDIRRLARALPRAGAHARRAAGRGGSPRARWPPSSAPRGRATSASCENAIEHAVALAEGDVLEESDLPRERGAHRPGRGAARRGAVRPPVLRRGDPGLRARAAPGGPGERRLEPDPRRRAAADHPARAQAQDGPLRRSSPAS